MGCARSFNPDIERGSDYNYREGYPEVRFNAVGLINESGTPVIRLAADIVYGSLIYEEQNGRQVSNLAIDVQVISQENSSDVVKSERYTFEIDRDDPKIVYSQEIYNFEEKITFKPGNYKINLTLTDQNSDKKITSTSQTYIPNPENEVSNITDIMMMGKDLETPDKGWAPITTYSIPGKIDSLKFVFQVTNTKENEILTVDSRLLRFESDTTIARPMHFNDYSPSTIQYQGIDYDETDVMQSTQRKLPQQGNVLIEFSFAQQQRGNYRFEVEAQSSADDSDMYKARDFGVKSQNYPSVKTARELARPLAYLMDDKEYKKMMNISDSDSLKKVVDRFWLRNIGNKNKTRKTIQKYYNRVEEANKQFSNFKEGWKTDTGMIYILFGPPWYVYSSLDNMEWGYAYDRSDPDRNFYFFQPRLESEYFPFQHHILERTQSYFSVQYQQIELWLSGLILQRNL